MGEIASFYGAISIRITSVLAESAFGEGRTSLMIAHPHEPPTIQPRRAHLTVCGRELLQHGVVHALPVRAVGNRKALVSPQTTSPELPTNLARPDLTSFTISRATQSPP